MCLINNNKLESSRYGRSKTNLTILSFFFTSIAEASSSVDSTDVSNADKLVYTLIGSLAVALLAHAAIPYIKYRLNLSSTQASYRAFLASNISSSLKRFGTAHTCEHARRSIHILEYTDWLEILENSGQGVPEVLISMHNALHKAKTEKSTFPFISYAGMPVTELDHEHPIWLLKASETSVISNYLLSQEQVEKSIKMQYSDTFMKLSESNENEKIEQWYKGAFSILSELAEHYVNTQVLKRHLELKHKIKFEN